MAEHGMTVWVKLSILKETFGPIRLLENNINDKQHNIYGEFRSVFFFLLFVFHSFVRSSSARTLFSFAYKQQTSKQTNKKKNRADNTMMAKVNGIETNANFTRGDNVWPVQKEYEKKKR